MPWDVILLTAATSRQAGLYRQEIERRRLGGSLPPSTQFLVVPDPEDRRAGSGGATINALAVLARPREWWSRHRVLLIHSGGDSRRLPQYSPSGKLFGVLPSRHPGATTTVFDETLALAAAWADRIPNGLLVASGDVVLRFDPACVTWDRPGVTGVAMRLDTGTAGHHGVYVVGPQDQVYTFLQKPSLAAIRDAGGLLEDGRVAVDIGLLRFDPNVAASLAGLAALAPLPAVDLYDHITRGLTCQWKPGLDSQDFWQRLSLALRLVPFHCSVVDGEFLHVGTTRSFRSIIAGAGSLLDSVVAGPCQIGHQAVILECDLAGPVSAARGAILHGLTGIPGPVDVPENTVVHQLPVSGPDIEGWVVRVYGVEDDPKQPSDQATWFSRPLLESLSRLRIQPGDLWPASEPPALWNAALFPVAAPEEAWDCARWMMGSPDAYGIGRWRRARRLSLAGSAQCVDGRVLAEARGRRLQGIWQRTAVELAESGTDLRPLLANLPGLAPAAAAARSLRDHAEHLRRRSPGDLTHAASHFMQAARLLDRAEAAREAAAAEDAAFACVQDAVSAVASAPSPRLPSPWQLDQVTVSAPPRIDLGGGWSDTPPFCLDWGGTVLNCAFGIDGDYPIETRIRRLDQPLIRCSADGPGAAVDYTSAGQLLEPCTPGSLFAIPRMALRLHGIPGGERSLRDVLNRLGGGLEVRCRVRLPVGSGLGTSSILAATVVQALAAMSGQTLENHALSDTVMHLEQCMTTGGGWQDQAGGIFPGAKLLITGPGLRQRIRVQPVAWSPERKAEFCSHLVLYDTGIQRMAKNLLRQVVARYLARETAALQVLHSIKTLAVEMSYAMAEADWKHLGELLDRHWQLNQILDPNTTNAPINALLDRARPYIYGAKLAGAGGGGFLMLLARDPQAAQTLRGLLDPASLVPYTLAEKGLSVQGAAGIGVSSQY